MADSTDGPGQALPSPGHARPSRSRKRQIAAAEQSAALHLPALLDTPTRLEQPDAASALSAEPSASVTNGGENTPDKPLTFLVKVLVTLFFLLTSGEMVIVIIITRLAAVDPTFIIDHHVVDAANIGGVLIGLVGFLYITYEFFDRKLLKGFMRVITPSLVGALILAPVGLLQYAYLFGLSAIILRGLALYALVGALIGLFNGLFVEWPHAGKKPRAFSWKGALVGLLSMFVVGFLADLLFDASSLMALIEGALLAPFGAIAGAIWRFINWGSSTATIHKPAPFSARGSLIGLIGGFLLGFGLFLALGGIAPRAAIEGGLLALTGGVVGAKWRFLTWEPPSSRGDQAPLFSWKGALIGLYSAFALGFLIALIVDLSFGAQIVGALRAALVAATFTALAGVATGGISRFIFWRADHLEGKQLGGIGAFVTLFGFALQLLAPLLSAFDIPLTK